MKLSNYAQIFKIYSRIAGESYELRGEIENYRSRHYNNTCKGLHLKIKGYNSTCNALHSKDNALYLKYLSPR
jgi:hypothetical protein